MRAARRRGRPPWACWRIWPTRWATTWRGCCAWCGWAYSWRVRRNSTGRARWPTARPTGGSVCWARRAAMRGPRWGSLRCRAASRSRSKPSARSSPSVGARQAGVSDAGVERLRQATPGVSSVVHFNHAGASLPSAATVDAMVEHLRREAIQGPMEAAQAVRDTLDAARTRAARLVGAGPDEIAFASGCSDAWGRAFAALGPWAPGDRILTGRHEWGGNLATMQQVAGRAGARIEPIPCDADGRASPEALLAMLDERVKLISLTWMPANGGLVNPAT